MFFFCKTKFEVFLRCRLLLFVVLFFFFFCKSILFVFFLFFLTKLEKPNIPVIWRATRIGNCNVRNGIRVFLFWNCTANNCGVHTSPDCSPSHSASLNFQCPIVGSTKIGTEKFDFPQNRKMASVFEREFFFFFFVFKLTILCIFQQKTVENSIFLDWLSFNVIS